jgi:hypothetical protein
VADSHKRQFWAGTIGSRAAARADRIGVSARAA